MDSYRVIRSIIRTEKGTDLGTLNKYLFEVTRDANKLEIKRAVEVVYKVGVVGVNIIAMRGKKKRIGFKAGRTPDWKKAVVTLKAGDTIEIAT